MYMSYIHVKADLRFNLFDANLEETCKYVNNAILFIVAWFPYVTLACYTVRYKVLAVVNKRRRIFLVCEQ